MREGRGRIPDGKFGIAALMMWTLPVGYALVTLRGDNPLFCTTITLCI